MKKEKINKVFEAIKDCFKSEPPKPQYEDIQLEFTVTNKTTGRLDNVEIFNGIWFSDQKMWVNEKIETNNLFIEGCKVFSLQREYANLITQPFLLESFKIETKSVPQIQQVVSFWVNYINGDTDIRRFVPVFDTYGEQSDKIECNAKSKKIIIGYNTAMEIACMYPSETFKIILKGKSINKTKQ